MEKYILKNASNLISWGKGWLQKEKDTIDWNYESGMERPL